MQREGVTYKRGAAIRETSLFENCHYYVDFVYHIDHCQKDVYISYSSQRHAHICIEMMCVLGAEVLVLERDANIGAVRE